jgi:hypothetical protein
MPPIDPEMTELTRRGRNLVKILLFFCQSETGNSRQSQLSEKIDVREDLISRYLNGNRDWSGENLEKAHSYLSSFSGAGLLTLSDLTDMSSEDLVRKIVPRTQDQHVLIGRLIPSPRPSQSVAALGALVGFYAGAYLCRNPDPHNTDQLAVAIDTFEFRLDDRRDQLFVEQVNFPHAAFVPTGRMRLRSRILEIDVEYMEGYPDGKFLAPLPELSPDGRYYFVATMLDVKIKSRLVVSRPILFMQINEDYNYEEWKAYPEGTTIYSLVRGFLEKNAQFERANFELCPTREASWSEWLPIMSELKNVLARQPNAAGETTTGGTLGDATAC